MSNVTTASAVARYAVAPADSAVNILEHLRDLTGRVGEISERVFVACTMAQGELEVFEPYDLDDELNDRRKSLADDLLEIEIAAHDLDELVDLISKLTS